MSEIKKYFGAALVLLVLFPVPSFGIAFTLLSPAPSPVLEPETVSYTNRCGVPLNSNFVAVVDRFISSGKTSGWWDSMIAVHFFCAPTQSAALVNAKGTNFILRAVDGIVHTPLAGFQGNGINGYLESSTSPSNLISAGFTTNSQSLFVFSQTDTPSVAADLGSMGPVTSIIGVRAGYTNSATIWSGSNTSRSFSNSTAKGLTGFVRNSTAGGFFVNDTEQTGFSLTASAALPSGTFRYFRLGTQAYYSSNQLAIGLIGNGNVTPGQAAGLYSSCVELLSTLESMPGIDSDFQAYMDRAPAGTEWNPQFVVAANRFIKHAKSVGWWNKMKAVHFLCAPGEEAAKLNVCGTNFNLTKSGTVTFYPNSGAQGDGTNGYLDIGTTLSGFGLTANGHSLFVYSQSDASGLWGELGAVGPVTSIIGLRTKNSGMAWIFSGSNAGVSYGVQSGVGLTGFVRTDFAGGFRVKDDLASDFSLPASDVPSSTFRYLRLGITSYYSPNRLAFGFIGDQTVSKTDAADIYWSCYNMLESMGTRVVPELDEPAEPPNAFRRECITNVTPAGLQIFRLAGPPASDGLNFAGNPPYSNTADKGYVYGPITDAITRPWGSAKTSTDTQVGRWELIWSDRANCGWGQKPNDTMGVINDSFGVQCRTEFTTYSNAIGSTLIKTAYSAGLKFRNDTSHPDGKGWGDIAEEWGYDVSPWNAYWAGNPNHEIFTNDLCVDTGDIVHRKFCATDPDAFFTSTVLTWKTSRDRVVLGQGRLCDLPILARGFVIDHEHADDRSPDLELRYIIEMRKIAQAKGFKLAVSTEPPCSGIGARSGFTTTNTWQILTNLEWMVILAGKLSSTTEQADYLQEQLDFFKGPNGDIQVPANRLCLQLGVGPVDQEIPLDQVAVARNFMISNGISKCAIIPGYAKFGGPISRTPNQVIATFLGLSTNSP
jgi:hypothetical protein